IIQLGFWMIVAIGNIASSLVDFYIIAVRNRYRYRSFVVGYAGNVIQSIATMLVRLPNQTALQFHFLDVAIGVVLRIHSFVFVRVLDFGNVVATGFFDDFVWIVSWTIRDLRFIDVYFRF